MDSEAYKSAKLNFVSNLNGTTLSYMISMISLFPLINFVCVLVKTYVLHSRSAAFKSNNFYWRSFLIDYLFCIVPLLCVCTIWADYVRTVQLCLMSAILVLYRLHVNKTSPSAAGKHTAASSSTSTSTFVDVGHTLLALSVASCRLWLYLLTCVTILAVDFRIYPRYLAKTERFGVSLMDLGVGFYIVVHAMKVVRKANAATERGSSTEPSFALLVQLPLRMLRVVKSSSILLAIGFARLVSLKVSGYVEHESEYGIHWNFLFTIFTVKVLACPLELIVKRSAMRSFLVAVLLAVYYQYLLTIKNYTSYLLSDGVRHAAWASSSTLAFLVNANKEGLFSCIGYLAIYFAFQAVCMRLMAIVESSRNADHSTMMSDCFNTCGTCVLNLLAMWVFFYVSLELARTRVQDVSRRLCNLSFICYILMSSILLLVFFMITILVMARLFNAANSKRAQKDDDDDVASSRLLETQLNATFSFATIVSDSKFIGITIFLLCNVLTGLVNISIDTLQTSDHVAFVVLCVYSFVSFALPFYLFKR